MLEKINEHYSFTAPATIYDEEALTTLELAARTAGKVNECVQAFNDLFKNVTNNLKGQDDKLAELNRHMSEFIGRGIPMEEAGAWAVLMAITKHYVDDGKFAEIYDKYADYIADLLNVERKRLDTLIGGATPASDSEVIDLRIDCEGNEWGSAGSAVRNITRTLLDRLEDFTKPNTITVAPAFVHEGKIMEIEYFSDGVSFTGTVKSGYGHSKLYNVSEGEKYYVSAYYGYRVPDVIFGDDELNPDGIANMPNAIGFGHMSSGAMSKNKFNKIVVVPEGATKMLVNWADNSADVSLIEAKKIESYSVDFEDLTNFINTALEPLESMHPKYSIWGEDTANSHEGYIIRLNENNTITPAIVADGSTAYKVATYKTKAGQRVKFSCCANFGNIFYCMYNSTTGEVHGYEQSATGSTRQYLDKEFVVPIGVDRICVANIDTYPEVRYMSGVSGASPFEGVTAYVVGDSISEYNDKAEKNYIEYLQEKTGISIMNLANSGAGFLNEKENNTHFTGQITTASTSAPDVFIVMGSGNDLKYVVNNLGDGVKETRSNTLYGQMNSLLTLVTGKYNGRAKLAFISPVPWKGYTPEKDGNVMEQYVEAMRKFCRAYSIPFLDLYHEGGLNPYISSHLRNYFDTEGVHPNAEGHKIIASPIYKFLLGVVGMEAE